MHTALIVGGVIGLPFIGYLLLRAAYGKAFETFGRIAQR